MNTLERNLERRKRRIVRRERGGYRREVKQNGAMDYENKWSYSVCYSLQGFLQSEIDILIPQAIDKGVQHGHHIRIKH